MKVLIAKQNEAILLELKPTLEFTPNTTNTSTFKVTGKQLAKIVDMAVIKGYKPRALMYY